VVEHLSMLQHSEDPTPVQIDILQLVESLHQSRLLAGTAACGEEPTQEFSIRTCSPWEPHVGADLEELRSVERTRIGEVCEGLHPVGGTPCWNSGTVCGGRSSRDEAR